MKILQALELPEVEHTDVQVSNAGVVKLYFNQGALYSKSDSGVEQPINQNVQEISVDGGTF